VSRTRRLIGAALVAAGGLAAALGWAWQDNVGIYQRDFVGLSEARVIADLGPPGVDSRTFKAGDAGEYTLGWHYAIGSRLGLVFKDGIVQRQWHGSK
jgi:hypothetical protein